MTSNASTNFSKAIRELRDVQRITQEQFAASIGVSRETVAFWESGATAPSIANVVRIADVFGMSIDELVRG